MATTTNTPEERISYLQLIDNCNRVVPDKKDAQRRHPSSKTPVLITELIRIVVGDVGEGVVAGYLSRDAYDRAGGTGWLSHGFQDMTGRPDLRPNTIAVSGSSSSVNHVLSENLFRDSIWKNFSILPTCMPGNEGKEGGVPHLQLLREPCKVELLEPHARFYGMLRHEVHLTVYSIGPDGKMAIYVQGRPSNSLLYPRALSQTYCRTVLRREDDIMTLQRLLRDHMPGIPSQNAASHGLVSYCTVGGEEHPAVARGRDGFGDGDEIFPLKDLVDTAIISCFSYCKEVVPEDGPSSREKGDSASPEESISSAEESSGGDEPADGGLGDEGVSEAYSVARVIDELKRGHFTPGSALSMIRFLISKGEITSDNEPKIKEIESKLRRDLPFQRAGEIVKDIDKFSSLDATVAEEDWGKKN